MTLFSVTGAGQRSLPTRLRSSAPTRSAKGVCERMRILQVSPDLILEIHDDGVVRLVSQDMARDRDPDCAGVVVIYRNEVDSLVAALMKVQEER